MRTLILITVILTGCAATQKTYHPYTYNGALSELHRNGNPDTRPVVPAYSSDLETPNRLVSRTCTSTPIFNIYGQFVRYHVECR